MNVPPNDPLRQVPGRLSMMRQTRFGVVSLMLALLAMLIWRGDGGGVDLFPERPATTSVPFFLSIYDRNTSSEFRATLNQDGTWTIDGDLDKALRSSFLSYGERCLLQKLQRIKSNPAADNSHALTRGKSFKTMQENPELGPCLPFMRGENTSREI